MLLGVIWICVGPDSENAVPALVMILLGSALLMGGVIDALMTGGGV